MKKLPPYGIFKIPLYKNGIFEPPYTTYFSVLTPPPYKNYQNLTLYIQKIPKGHIWSKMAKIWPLIQKMQKFDSHANPLLQKIDLLYDKMAFSRSSYT